MTPLLQIENLELRRNGRSLLRDVSWTIAKGERWAVLGANGAGKTSLLGCVTGHVAPTRGAVSVAGNRFGRTDWRQVKKSIGWVSNALGRDISPQETGLTIVAGGPDARLNLEGLDVDTTRAADMLRHHGISHLGDARWAWMSQGERQKCLIARAFSADFQLLFLDEPCAGLDPAARHLFLRWLQSLKTGPGLVMVTHHVEELPADTSHALILKDGGVLSVGSVGDVLTSETLSEAFATPVRLEASKLGWRLEVLLH